MSLTPPTSIARRVRDLEEFDRRVRERPFSNTPGAVAHDVSVYMGFSCDDLSGAYPLIGPGPSVPVALALDTATINGTNQSAGVTGFDNPGGWRSGLVAVNTHRMIPPRGCWLTIFHSKDGGLWFELEWEGYGTATSNLSPYYPGSSPAQGTANLFALNAAGDAMIPGQTGVTIKSTVPIASGDWCRVWSQCGVLWAEPMFPSPINIAWVGSSGISARTGDPASLPIQPGSGTVTLYYRDGASNLVPQKDDQGADITVTVFNWTGAASGADRFVLVSLDTRRTWWYLGEDCAATGTGS